MAMNATLNQFVNNGKSIILSKALQYSTKKTSVLNRNPVIVI